MDCADAREWVSATLDDEAPPEILSTLDAHLRGCGACRGFRERAADLHRTVRVQIAVVEPDRTREILAALPRAEARSDPARALRLVIAGIAIVQLAVATPLFFAHDHMGGHFGRHVAVSAFSFAVGLLVVAWRPARAAALLPVLVVLVVGLAWTCLGDIVAGRPVPAGALAHALDLAGLAAVMALHRAQRDPVAVRRGALTR